MPTARASNLRSITGDALDPADDRPQRLLAARMMFAPDRLRLARSLAGKRKKELADAVGVTPSAVSQYEAGATSPSTEILALLALHLGVPVEFFHRDPTPAVHDAQAAHFRSLRRTTQLERNQALAYGELLWRASHGLSHWVQLPAVTLPDHPVALDADPAEVERAAAAARDDFGLGEDPIPHVVRVAETHGVLVGVSPYVLSARVDAFSHWFSGRPVIVLSGQKDDAARSRFDAAHELGHLVMHHDTEPGSQLAERQAHRFASCLLAPPPVLADLLPRRLDWARLGELKQQWGMSLKSLAFAAHRMGVWSDSTYRTAMQGYNAAGWNAREPRPIGPAEQPSMLGKAMNLLVQHGVPVSEIETAAALPAEVLRQIVASASEQDRPVLTLTLDL